MFKKIILILALICMIVLPVFSQTGDYTTNKYFYLPEYGAYGMDEYNEYNLYMQKADTQIETNKTGIADIDLSLYYLKTEINTQGKVETIWGVSLTTDTELAALKFTDLADTPATYDNGKYAKSTADGVVWDTPTGAGDMLKATYDTDADGDIDVAAGGTEKSSWTLYAIPYLSGTTAFGEITIGTEGQVLKVSAGATSYEFAAESGGVDTSGTPVDNDFAKFTDADTIEGRSYSETMEDLNPVTTKTAVATLTIAEAGTVLVSCVATPYTITLPTAVGHSGLRYHFIKTDANYFLITLDGDGTETFNYENSTGAPVLTYARLNTYCAEVTVVSDGSNWQVIDEAMGQVPECRVDLSANQLDLTDSKQTLVEFDQEDYDIGSNFNTTTHYFTCPIPGSYLVTSNVAYVNIIANKRYFVIIYKNAVGDHQVGYHTGDDTGAIYGTLSGIVKGVATDTISTWAGAYCGVSTVDIYGGIDFFTYMQIRLIAKD